MLSLTICKTLPKRINRRMSWLCGIHIKRKIKQNVKTPKTDVVSLPIIISTVKLYAASKPGLQTDRLEFGFCRKLKGGNNIYRASIWTRPLEH